MANRARIQAHPQASETRGLASATLALLCFLALYLGAIPFASHLKERYEALESLSVKDRGGAILPLAQNERGSFMTPADEVPARFDTLLLKKEDRYFYYHLGINPISALRGVLSLLLTGKAGGVSTITEQLVKILLGNERDRTIANKLIESLGALALELHASKREILAMYEDAAYFGKGRQGVTEASRYFFNKRPMELTEPEMLQLIAALGSPTRGFPGSERNKARLPLVAAAVGGAAIPEMSPEDSLPSGSSPPPTPFELKTLDLSCSACQLTIDASLTEKAREALRRRIEAASKANVHNGAVVIIKLPENELLAVIGSQHPGTAVNGSEINMALLPRPIGSTAKPFIYLAAFMKGARPYTIVLDREYSYTIGTGFAFYPKNFDGAFRGPVTLHEALSNSLNVPAVKVLEFVGLPAFYKFLGKGLGLLPRQPFESYELGIALGALEMDLLTLSHLFSILPNEGILKPLTIEKERRGGYGFLPMERKIDGNKRVASREVVQLVNKILSDRETAVPQFGLRSTLTLPHKNYALKTGTSRDYHDSWVVGFTPDFLVGVWLGNSDNSPMREVTGQGGAGGVFEDVMTLLYSSPYNRGTAFSFDRLKEFGESGTIEYGLPSDDYRAARDLLLNASLVISPHDGDIIELTEDTTIPLKAGETVDWFINGAFLARGAEARVAPKRTGELEIEARGGSKTELVRISIVPPR